MFRSLLAAGLLVRLCAAQQSGWQAGQVNATMCYWDSPRAAVVRDTLYIDGGELWWTPGMNDGSYGPPTGDDNPLGIVYQLNFSNPFNTTAQTNFSSVFTTQSKASAGGAANNVAPNYYDGVMLANDYEWFIYGGLTRLTDKYTAPDSQSAAAYEVYASGPPKSFQPGYILEVLPSGVTRYVTNGAGASIPSENLGFYFGGLRSASSGPIYYLAGNESANADVLSTTMIELNMAVQTKETWKNNTLPPTVPGRINGELVWVPVSKQGVLVAIGGVVEAEFAEFDTSLDANQTADTKARSPLLMSTVSVYDIATSTWYEQPTSNAPPMLTQGCTVMASAQDGSSHNIYWYGGWDGIDNTKPFSDDVWVLSIPSFMWTKVSTGTSSHARAGHRCVKPYPDQMFVIGGYTPPSGTIPQCLPGNIIQIFNLSSTTWIENYNPTVWSNYSVPSVITSMIGGTGTGSATQTTPSPSGFANSSLGPIFSSAYNTSKITNWYPYHLASSPRTNTTNTPTVSPVPKPSSGTPSYLGPVLGVVLGLFFLTLAIVGFLLWRRRHLFRSSAAGGQSENGTMDNRRWVTNWLRSTPVDAKAPTVTTDETPISPYGDDDGLGMGMGRAEVGGRQVFEMMDTSRLVELHDQPTGLHHIPMAATVPHQSNTSSPSATTPSSSPRPAVSPVVQGREGFISGISGVSESDRGHLRGISETSGLSGVSAENFVTPTETPGAGKGLGIAAEGQTSLSKEEGGEKVEGEDGGVKEHESTQADPLLPRSSAVSPITPPKEGTGGDYLSAAGEGVGSGSFSPGAVNRRSNFSEELGEDGKS